MAERINAEMGCVDVATADLGGPSVGRLLDRLDKAVDWDALVEPIRDLPEYQPAPLGPIDTSETDGAI